MKMRRFLMMTLMATMATAAWGQDVAISGRVVDNSGAPLPGVNVVVEGTTTGTVTDMDGNYTLNAPRGANVVYSFIGFNESTVAIENGKTRYDVTLEDESISLGDVVVVGYGVQKKSVVTASIAKVSADDLSGTTPVRIDNALKGMASGVTVTSASGQPGAASQIRIRGIGTINNSDPLYIVDGMPIEGGIDYLNPSDIESIEVLKDAASGAIYGTRAANGVIMVTTKGGQKGKVTVNYSFTGGISNPWKHRDVLNATEYAVMMNEGLVNAGEAAKYADPYSLGEGTDWQDEVFNDNAPSQTHELSISGASDKVNYYISMGYNHQEGIVGGDYDRSNYRRLTLRSNTTYTLFDNTRERGFLNKMDLGANISYARIHSRSIDANSQWGSVLGSALYLSPILRPTVEGKEAKAQADKYGSEYMLYDGAGRMYTIPGSTYQEMNNPLAMLSLPGDDNWSHKFVANLTADLTIGWGVKYRFSYGADLSFWGVDGYTPLYYLSGNNRATITSARQSSDRGTVWQVENVVTWDKEFGGHSVNLVLGQSAMQNTGKTLSGSVQNLKDMSKPYMNNSSAEQSRGEMSASGGPSNEHTLSSYFVRGSYNYDERYMAQVTVRRDGSSRFGSNNRYATFPSFSLGWNVLNEPYVEAPEWLTNVKVRGSWGKNGNDNIGDFTYAAWTSGPSNSVFGKGENVVNGVQAGALANPDLKWEESIQTDLGLDLGFMGNALNISFDWYKKKTSGMIIEMPIPNYVGADAPLGNVGDMENTGIELELSYKWNAGPVKMHAKGNASFLKNTLTNLGNTSGYLELDQMQNTGTITRASNDEPFPYFYGYKTAGIFQTQAEVEAYKNSEGALIQPDAVAGDVRFVDIDGDGAITAADRTKIGKGMPDWTYGLTIGAEWNGVDFMVLFQGTVGNDIYDATRRTDVRPANLPSYMLNRWTGEGTSDKYPRYVVGDSKNWQSSDLYVTDGSYFRLKNIQLGYTIPRDITQKAHIDHMRVFVGAENLLTLTKYAGFDPEISSGGTSLGVDYGVYPQSRTFNFGVSVSF